MCAVAQLATPGPVSRLAQASPASRGTTQLPSLFQIGSSLVLEGQAMERASIPSV